MNRNISHRVHVATPHRQNIVPEIAELVFGPGCAFEVSLQILSGPAMPPSALTENIKIQNANGAHSGREVLRSQSTSVSPTETFYLAPSSASWGAHNRGTARNSFRASAAGAASSAKLLKPFKGEDIRVLLLENINQTGKDILSQQGYQVESLKSSLPEDQLIEKIKCVVSMRHICCMLALIDL